MAQALQVTVPMELEATLQDDSCSFQVIDGSTGQRFDRIAALRAARQVASFLQQAGLQRGQAVYLVGRKQVRLAALLASTAQLLRAACEPGLPYQKWVFGTV